MTLKMPDMSFVPGEAPDVVRGRCNSQEAILCTFYAVHDMNLHSVPARRVTA